MKQAYRWLRVVALDVLGVGLMIGAVLIGWLPGPGGIPMFLVGLGFLAINHRWARRYIRLVKRYASRVGDMIFIKRFWVLYDLAGAMLLVAGSWWLWQHTANWMWWVGYWAVITALIVLLGNRHRWTRLSKWVKRQIRA